MLLNPNLDIFQGVPQTFLSPFASRDSQLSAKYQTFLKAAGDAKISLRSASVSYLSSKLSRGATGSRSSTSPRRLLWAIFWQT
ncbi:hypothetical protein [Nannocystis pusilla]|uniref:hypothetical protein n=1 Tax=Nannocystis pusilla TaxID=889268 RepID=UPI003B7E782E